MMTNLDRMNLVEMAGLVYDQVEYATGKHKSEAAEQAALIAAATDAETLAKALRKYAAAFPGTTWQDLLEPPRVSAGKQ
ncbi:MAG: hypothetical protein J5858_14425 [Lentisphaeria bacterium]|nr:hypothetical protein [Lentisphaeria bacterium]